MLDFKKFVLLKANNSKKGVRSGKLQKILTKTVIC